MPRRSESQETLFATPDDAQDAARESVVVYTDGCALGNPGPGGAAAVLFSPDGERLATVSEPLGHSTNNEAEYAALLLGLVEAERLGAARVEVRADSQLVLRQVRGEYRIKTAHLRPLAMRVRKAMAAFDRVTLTEIGRDDNDEADGLAKAAAKAQGGDDD